MHETKLSWTKHYFSMLEYVIGLNMKLHYYSLDFSKLTINYFEDRSRLLISSMILQWPSQWVICYPVVASARDQYTFAFFMVLWKKYCFLLFCNEFYYVYIQLSKCFIHKIIFVCIEMLIWNWSLRLRKFELCDRKL